METLTGRRGRTAATATLLAAAALTLAACSSSGSSTAASGSSGSPVAVASASASPVGSSSAPASVPASSAPASTPASVASSVPGGAAMQSGTDTFLAEGQDINGTVAIKPACDSTYGCALSGDSTAFLDNMTWRTWSASAAVGSGTYKIDDCNPSCASAHVYPVETVITLTDPVKVCSAAGTRWFWSRASFTYPQGLPKALQGSNAPQNPWTFATVIGAAQQSCAS